MKKILLSMSLIFSFVGYTAYRNNSQLFIKNSKTASTQNADSTMFVKAGDLPKAKATVSGDLQENVSRGQSFVEYDDDDEYEDDDDDDDDEGEGINTVKIQIASTKTPVSQTVSSQKSSVPSSMSMMNMSGNHMMNMGQYKNGEYIGNIADAYYGDVQIKAVVSGGKIVDVLFLDYPHARQNSIRINTYAMPILKSEAIQAQSAKVDAVSGASATSGAFKESLSSAIAQAKI